MQVVAQSWLVYRLTGSALLLAAAVFGTRLAALQCQTHAMLGAAQARRGAPGELI